MCSQRRLLWGRLCSLRAFVLEADPYPEVRRDDVVMARGVQANGAVAMAFHRESLNGVIPIQLGILAHSYDDVDKLLL